MSSFAPGTPQSEIDAFNKKFYGSKRSEVDESPPQAEPAKGGAQAMLNLIGAKKATENLALRDKAKAMADDAKAKQAKELAAQPPKPVAPPVKPQPPKPVAPPVKPVKPTPPPVQSPRPVAPPVLNPRPPVQSPRPVAPPVRPSPVTGVKPITGGMGQTPRMKAGGSVVSASKRGDGIAQRGKTKGRIL